MPQQIADLPGRSGRVRAGVQRVGRRVREAAEWTRLVAPCHVISHPEKLIPIQIRLDEANAEASVELVHEDGAVDRYPVALEKIPQSEHMELEEGHFVRKLAPLPPQLALGYYDLNVRVGDRQAACRLIVTPERAWCPENLRTAGVAISLYGMVSSLPRSVDLAVAAPPCAWFEPPALEHRATHRRRRCARTPIVKACNSTRGRATKNTLETRPMSAAILA